MLSTLQIKNRANDISQPFKVINEYTHWCC